MEESLIQEESTFPSKSAKNPTNLISNFIFKKIGNSIHKKLLIILLLIIALFIGISFNKKQFDNLITFLKSRSDYYSFLLTNQTAFHFQNQWNLFFYQKYHDEGTQYILKNNYQKALESYLKAYAYRPKNPYLLLQIGDTYYSQAINNFKKADEFYSRVVIKDISPKDYMFLKKYGEFYTAMETRSLKERNYPNVIKYGNKALQIQTTDKFRLYSDMLSAYLVLGKSYEAQFMIDKSLQLIRMNADTPYKSTILKSTGDYYLNYKGEYDKALSYYKSILDIPNSPFIANAYLGIGKSYFYLGRYNEAIPQLNNVLKFISKSQFNDIRLFYNEIYKQIGRIYLQTGKYDEAIEYFNKINPITKKDNYIIKSIPDYEEEISYYYGLGLSNLRKNNIDKALDYLNTGLKLISNNKTSLFNNTSMTDLYSLLLMYEQTNLFYTKGDLKNAKITMNKILTLNRSLTPKKIEFIERMQWPKDTISIFDKIKTLNSKMN